MTQEQSWASYQEVIDGANDIKATTELAMSDITFAETRIAAAVSMTASLAATKKAIAAWNPSATYKSSDLVAVKGQLTGIIDQLSTISIALNELYTYRKVNDQNVVATNNALIWIAKHALGGNGGKADGLF